jgi:PAS domain S-box-containing protein
VTPATVLVVDDDVYTRELIQFGLEGEGYRVLTAPEGQAALDILGGESINLVLLDLVMPVMDGVTFARNYKRQRPPLVPVVVVSAAQDAARRARDLGAAGHLDKPFDLDDLLLSVEHALVPPSQRGRPLGMDHAGEASEQHVRTILERITDGYFALDANWQLTYVNPAVMPLLRHYSDELLGCSVWDAFPEVVGSEFGRAYHQAMHDRVPVECEAVYPILKTWFSARVFPTNDGGLSVYLRDVTENRRVAP